MDDERITLTDAQRKIGMNADTIIEHWKKSTLWTADHVALEKKKSDFFLNFTGLSKYHLNGTHRYEIVFAQGQRIANLKLQMAQMHKGYRRKIARLEKRIAELEKMA